MTATPESRPRLLHWWNAPTARLYAAVFLCGCITALLASFHIPITSDQSSILLEANSFRHGNLLLHGWVLPADNFLFSSIPIYALAISVFGISDRVFHIVPPLFYGIFTALMVWHARYQEEKAPRRRVITVLVLLLLLFPSCAGLYPALTVIFIEHVATLIGILLAWLLLRLMRSQSSTRHRTILAVVAGCVLALTTASDPFALFLFDLPFLLLLLRQAVMKNHHPISIHEGISVLIALIAGLLLPVAVHHFGGFSTVEPLAHFTTLGSVPIIAGRFISYLFMVSGSPFWGGSIRSFATLVEVGHGFILLCIIIAVLGSFFSWLLNTSSATETSSVLSLGIIITTGALLTSEQLQPGTERYVLLILLLAIPVVASQGATWLLSRAIAPWVLPTSLVLVGVTMLAGYAPAVHKEPSVSSSVASFLLAHHLTTGFSDYWDAASVTVASRNAVTVAPIFAFGKPPTVVPQQFLADAAWFSKPAHSKTWFVIVNPQEPLYGLTPGTLGLSFGNPTETYQVDGLTIEVWTRNLPDLINKNAAVAASHGPVPFLPPAA